MSFKPRGSRKSSTLRDCLQSRLDFRTCSGQAAVEAEHASWKTLCPVFANRNRAWGSILSRV